MANEIKFKSFVYPGCIEVCNGGAKYVNGNLPIIARIYPDRSIVWERKRISDQMREYVSEMANRPFIAVSISQNYNFFEN